MKRVLVWAVGAWIVLVAPRARADVTPPDGVPCQGRAEGASCIMMDGTSGVCQTVMSSRALPDGASQPVSYLACRPGSGMDAGSDAGSGPTGGGCSCRASGAGGSHGGREVLALGATLATVIFARRRRLQRTAGSRG